MRKTGFREKVYKVVRLVPSGKVVSYGQVALYIGVPNAARQVGWVLSMSKDTDMIPWWRVVNGAGRISIKASRFSAEEQRELLRQEGVAVSQAFTFDIEKYRFQPDNKLLSELDLDPIIRKPIR